MSIQFETILFRLNEAGEVFQHHCWHKTVVDALDFAEFLCEEFYEGYWIIAKDGPDQWILHEENVQKVYLDDYSIVKKFGGA